jgi:hypothetical protein
MSYDAARYWVLAYSLCLTGVMLPFFFLAPVLGYPLEGDQARQALSLVLPVFLGYLGSGIVFIFNPPGGALPELSDANRRMLSLLIHGIFFVFAVSLLALLIAFGVSNKTGRPPGSGMQFTAFSNGITVLLSVMTTVVGAAVIYLFGIQPRGGQGSGDGTRSSGRVPPADVARPRQGGDRK